MICPPLYLFALEPNLPGSGSIMKIGDLSTKSKLERMICNLEYGDNSAENRGRRGEPTRSMFQLVVVIITN